MAAGCYSQPKKAVYVGCTLNVERAVFTMDGFTLGLNLPRQKSSQFTMELGFSEGGVCNFEGFYRA